LFVTCNSGYHGNSRHYIYTVSAFHLTEYTPNVCCVHQEGVKTENNDHINLKVAGQDGSVVQFKIKRHTPLSKLMKAYCERQGLTIRQIRFRFDGQPINETDTPAQLEMEDEDTIDVFQQQTGGLY
uniref:Small ubiquitin-related modifier n=1 Tax=Oncorhynchus tshawytscha TaxID=74940 RepID=A0AAZ3S8Y9_ONCTS